MTELSPFCPYHCRVRLLLIAVMIALLPLRGWMGDAMALSMVTSGHAHTAAAADAAQHMPCHDAGAQQMHGDPAPQETVDGPAAGSHAHALCDLCNGPALDIRWLWAPSSSTAPQLVPSPVEAFASQDARRDVRPPIS